MRRNRRTSSLKDGKEERPSLDDPIGRMRKAMHGFYCEAASMLPLESMPELRGCILVGGHCFGLLDPVSNIILNAIALLVVGGREYPAPDQIGDDDGQWYHIAHLSYMGLRAFMTAYFRYLSPAEARNYLCRSSYDLPRAISLMCQDRMAREEPLLPDGDEMKAALRAAAIEGQHPDPDILAYFMTVHYPSQYLRAAIATLRQRQHLGSDCVLQIKSLLRLRWPAASQGGWTKIEFNNMLPAGDYWFDARVGGTTLLDVTTSVGENLVARIVVQEVEQHTQSEYKSQSEKLEYIPDASMEMYNVSMPPIIYRVSGDNVPYLKMSLLETMHVYYIKALAKLPNSRRLLRALLVAGHCHGPLDTVSNIILNSIWYDMAFPPAQDTEDQLPQGEALILLQGKDTIPLAGEAPIGLTAIAGEPICRFSTVDVTKGIGVQGEAETCGQ
ncbi:hypothetical protein PR202_gb01701 [Eleusine coracana subsp. coracana]|uniref:PIR2-like helical domain-containing protein n=1 Tax=Eleusine coracana subsp. coracana TaxID=191504 RepID=A0AAV5DWW5_ELECO|nr:hypothetical protein PR202_gb01701 [Eleusine coracana subsp. coracana]